MLCKQPGDIDKYFNIQKQRLRTGYVDYYLMHSFNSFKQWEKLCGFGIEDWISSKKASGEVGQVGFSFHGSLDDYYKIIDAYDWDFTQIQYNYLNTHYQAGVDGLKYAHGKGFPVLVMEPLLGGKLATGLPDEAIKLMREKKPDSTPVSWALSWLWNQPEVTLLLSGMNELKQLRENLKLADQARLGMLDEDEEKVIQEVVGIITKNYRIQCTGCNYCMPCPKRINIPTLFSTYNTSFTAGRISGIFQYVMSVGAMGSDPHYASNCIQCGKCESKCPQGIQIRNELKAVKSRLQVPGIKALAPLLRKIVR